QHANFARIRSAVTLEDLDGRRLARAIRSEDGEDLARLDRERQAIDDAAAVVLLHQVADFDRRGGVRLGHEITRLHASSDGRSACSAHPPLTMRGQGGCWRPPSTPAREQAAHQRMAERIWPSAVRSNQSQ